MNTKRWNVDTFVDKFIFYPQIVEAAQILRENDVVAFPTETVYGLGANALNNEAVSKIFTAKGRPNDNPLIVHIAKREQLDELVKQVPFAAEKLIEAFWPGPLAIILPVKAGVLSEKVTAGLETVAVRMPDHPIALSLIEAADVPVAAPSANSSGKPSPTTAQHVLDDLFGKIAGVVDGGETGVGVESTVVDCTTDIPTVLRPGGITMEQLEEVVGEITVDPSLQEGKGTPKSPGMKYTHYAPDAPLLLFEGDQEALQQAVNDLRAQGKKVGVLGTEETTETLEGAFGISCGNRSNPQTVAQKLYHTLRLFNEVDVDIILAEVFSKEGVGLAIMNRLEKAAGYCYYTKD
ncbi:L-threonylcarbamoyladenylate synthase [Bacillus sp. 2205SS5-2]|uniref:L-threonylcarbamoyladenylate synthase n=1 Tax=Bacillus sp. 2205SS5-2 TaxID=3109031 RepID=UPI003006913E